MCSTSIDSFRRWIASYLSIEGVEKGNLTKINHYCGTLDTKTWLSKNHIQYQKSKPRKSFIGAFWYQINPKVKTQEKARDQIGKIKIKTKKVIESQINQGRRRFDEKTENR